MKMFRKKAAARKKQKKEGSRMRVFKINRREMLLLCIAVSVMAGVGYIRVRYWPAAQALAAIHKETEDLRTKLKVSQLPKEPPEKEINQMEQELAGIAQQFETWQARIGSLEHRFVPVDSSESLQALKVEISSLARRQGVLIVKDVSYQAAPQDKSLAWFLDKGLYQRPLRQITVESPYPYLLKFIQGLQNLPYQVTIVRLEIMLKGDASNGSALTSTLILSL